MDVPYSDETLSLDNAVAVYRQNLQLCPPSHPVRLKMFHDLAVALFQRYMVLGGMNDLQESIACFCYMLTLCPVGHPLCSSSLGNLANALCSRFEQLGQMEDLEQAILHHRQALSLCPPDDRSAYLNNLANVMAARFEEFRQMEDLEEAIALHQQVLYLCPPGHPDHSLSLNNLANDLRTRFGQLGQMEDLEKAIVYDRKAFDLRPPGDPDRSSSLNNLANDLYTRSKHSREMQDLEEAIILHREALDLRPPGHPDRSASLSNLASAISFRFEQLGEMEDLDEAIVHHRQALNLRPPGHPDRWTSLDNVANTVSIRFRELGQVEDLEEAIVHHREALNLRPPNHPDRSKALDNLAKTLSTRFRQLGEIEDLEEALVHHREALDLRPTGHPERSASLNNLANTVYTRFHQSGRMEDLEEAIVHHREGLNLCSPGHPGRSLSLNNLSSALCTRFEQFGKMEDLEEAIMLQRQALTLNLPDYTENSASLNNLANALKTRFEQLGKVEDLNEAIMHHRQALILRPSGHSMRSGSLNNLASAVYTRFEHLGKMEDLEEAVEHHRQALDLRPPGHPDRSVSLNNLASTLSTRFEQSGKMEDLEEAITHHRQALDICPPGHPDRSASLKNLAIALSSRSESLQNLQDLEESVELFSDAEKFLHPDHPEHATTRSQLASRILQLCRHSPGLERDSQMIPDAFALFESAANHPTSRAHDQLLAALQWVQAARRFQHSSILRAYSTALACLDRRVTVTPTVESWQKFLAINIVPPSLASDAASSAIEAGDLETAVELLEQGRSILWSKMQRFRHPLDELRDIHEDLADEFDSVSRELEHHAMSSEIKSPPPGFYDRQTKNHRVLSEKWDEVVRRIRQIDGFETFLQAVPFASLRSAASEGPVIVVNISRYRSDAIILQKEDPPVLVCLPDALPETLKQLSVDLSTALALDGVDRARAIFPTLQELWDIVVSPVVHRLATLGVAEKSRIWWCPTSHLCALPLHAAGPYFPQQKNLPDIYTSSYTSTLSSLIRARSQVVHRPTAPKVLAMGQPNDHLEESKLPLVREELRRIQSLGNSVDVFLGEQAKREILFPLLQQYSWVHFACHGHLAAEEPFLSSFQLYGNEQLTLADLIKARLPNAELAFLSACHSAAINVDNTPDEVIHLAAALQFCGFRSVVGTMWAMADVDGPDVAEGFYGHMFRDGAGGAGDFRDSAVALNHATREMRKKRVPIDRWINFVHIGA